MTGLIVDNFAGGGGASTGIEMGLRRFVDIAINHDSAAIGVHKANHPYTFHYCQSVWQADPREVCGSLGVDLAWFSPDCKHFSKAKGGRPVDKNIRDLAWVVIDWAKRVHPKVIILENVEEFKTWGPIAEDGKPCKQRQGTTFNEWVLALRNLGYQVQWKELRACDYGAPTTRKRLFLIARRDGQPISWPKPTHGEGLLPYKTAAECIDWSLPCTSIFGRKIPLKEATLRRIAAGIQKFVIDAKRPFIVPITHTKAPPKAYSIDEPLRTITTAKGGEFALVTSHIMTLRKNSIGQSLETPLATLTTSQHFAEIRAFLVKYYGNDKNGQQISEPLHTITTKERFGLVTVSIGGEDFAIADIGIRMLTPRELARAQGFPENYILDPECEYSTPSGKTKFGKLPKVHQIAKIGNSVCPIMAAVLSQANNPNSINERLAA